MRPRHTSNQQGRTGTILRAVLPLPAAAALAFVLKRFPPEQYGFYPRCPFHAAFGLLCPGCGGTRAIAALLRGDLRQALALNPLVTLLAPAGCAWAAAAWLRFAARRPLPALQPPPAALYAAAAVALVFTVARNL